MANKKRKVNIMARAKKAAHEEPMEQVLWTAAKKYGYPPDKQEQAIQLVMTQAANLADDWAQE